MIARSGILSLQLFVFGLIVPVLTLSVLTGCSNNNQQKTWHSLIPEESPVVMLHDNQDFFSLLDERRFAMLQELSEIQMDAVSALQQHHSGRIPARATALFPSGTHQLEPLFILEDPGVGIHSLADPFRREFAENSYRFQGQRIRILHLDDMKLFAAQKHDWIIMSRSSVAVENSILTYNGKNPEISIRGEQLADGDFLLNTPSLSNWVELLGAPRYLPRFKHMLQGSGPAVINLTDDDYDDPLHDFSLTGSIPLTEESSSRLINAFTAEPARFDLDRYIPSDAAFFSVFQQDPDHEAVSYEDAEPVSPLDTLLMEDREMRNEILQMLGRPTAFVAFEASGFLSTGEHMLLRRLDDTQGFGRFLQQLQRDGHIEVSNGVYHVNSNILANLLGGPLNRFTDFYVMRSAEVAIITGRGGLAQRIDQDRRRRTVMHYDDDYNKVRERHPEMISAWIYTQTSPLLRYLDPKLNPINHAAFLGTLVDVGAVSLVRNEQEVSLQMDSYYSEDRAEPVRDLWAYDLGGSRLTGRPILANIGGGARDELVVATDGNEVVGIASDGSGFFNVQTGINTPIGSPVVYDWYGNNQPAVFVAAGNSIYAWNNRGIPLPNFPVTMDERITAPLAIADVSQNGRPEMVVATADRKVHVLDQRGRNIPGWPMDLNVQVSHKPVIRDFDGRHAVWVTAGNGLFGFSPEGDRLNNFPVFIDSDFGPITIHENHILAGASDGHLYAVGKDPLFADSLIVSIENGDNDIDRNDEDKINVHRVYVGNAPVLNAPIVKELTIEHGNGEAVQGDMIGVQTLDGNLFLLGKTGQLHMTRNMGQNAAEYDNMMITDITGDGNREIIGVAGSGRVYAWHIASGEQVTDIPSASLRHPIVYDILGNGEKELIGQTRDGLRCWSFRRP